MAFTPVLYQPVSYAVAQKALVAIEICAVTLIFLTVSPWFAERRRRKPVSPQMVKATTITND